MPLSIPFYLVAALYSYPILSEPIHISHNLAYCIHSTVPSPSYIMSVLRQLPRSFAVARRAASTSAPLTVSSTRTNASAPILANIEASWKSLPAEEQYEVYQQLEEIQKRDWKELTIDEKKAGKLGFCLIVGTSSEIRGVGRGREWSK
jgi:hypothetical protein